MIAFALLTVLLCIVLSTIGLPISFLLMRQDVSATANNRDISDHGWLMLAPAFGAVLYLGLGTDLHFVGLGSRTTFLLLVVSGIVASVCTARWKRRLWLMPFQLCAIAVAAGAALATNVADLSFAGLDYFPLVNDDTFSYLGLIDQIRINGWTAPTITYPAGYFPLIEHAVRIRVPGAVLASDFAAAFRLQTHSAFFIVQRLTLPVVAMGAAGIAAVVTGSALASALCFCSLVLGNALLNQILQQFNSCAMGSIVAVAAIAAGLWTTRAERSNVEAVAGHGLTGLTLGTMAMTSIEAHPFYLCIFGAAFVALVGTRRTWRIAICCALSFAAVYVLVSSPVLPQLYPILMQQYFGAAVRTDNAAAVPGFVVYASGVGFKILASWSSYERLMILTAIGALVTAIIALGWLARQALRSRPSAISQTDAAFLFIACIVPAAFQILLYKRGIGYGLIKVTDYFGFVGPLVVSVCAAGLLTAYGRGTAVLSSGLVALFCFVAVKEKRSIIEMYYNKTVTMPRLADYYIGTTNPLIASRDHVLKMEMHNLYLYMNRMETSRIGFDPAESNRYRPTPAR